LLNKTFLLASPIILSLSLSLSRFLCLSLSLLHCFCFSLVFSYSPSLSFFLSLAPFSLHLFFSIVLLLSLAFYLSPTLLSPTLPLLFLSPLFSLAFSLFHTPASDGVDVAAAEALILVAAVYFSQTHGYEVHAPRGEEVALHRVALALPRRLAKENTKTSCKNINTKITKDFFLIGKRKYF
jgi:hypothetical protein